VSNSVFVTSPSFAKDHPEVIETWRKCLQQGIDFIHSDEAKARESLAEWLQLPPKIAQEAPFPAFTIKISAEEIAPFGVMLKATGQLKDVPDVEPLIYKGP